MTNTFKATLFDTNKSIDVGTVELPNKPLKGEFIVVRDSQSTCTLYEVVGIEYLCEPFYDRHECKKLFIYVKSN